VVLFAHTPAAASVLSRAWRESKVAKDYRALVTGRPTWDRMEITARIGRVPHPRLGTVFGFHDQGRPSCSVASVAERRGAGTLCDVRILTGRPHQVRIHLSWARHALEGDPLYASGGLPRAHDPGLPGDGGYLLHGHRIQCAHPTRAATLTVEAPPPGALATETERLADQPSRTSRTLRVSSARV
jgi:23S rRNA pseudouridine1911/1915/1917 synthase